MVLSPEVYSRVTYLTSGAIGDVRLLISLRQFAIQRTELPLTSFIKRQELQLIFSNIGTAIMDEWPLVE
jgi:hypothetical protein